MEAEDLKREATARVPLASADTETRLAEEEQRAEAVYDRLVIPVLRPEDDGKFVAIDFEGQDFEIDPDDYSATGRLLARRPGARLWLMRVGRQPAYRVRASFSGGS